MRLMLRKILAVLLTLTLVISVPVTLQASEYYMTVSVDVTYCQTEARSMLDMINDFRTGDDAWYWNSDDTTKTVSTNLDELEYDYALEAIAMQRAAEIGIYWSHTRPNGESCFNLSYSDETTVVSIQSWGENIAAGQRSAEAAFEAWQETDEDYSGQGHRRNMLNESFTAVGIACVYYNGTYYWVQEFGYSTSSAVETEANDSETTVDIDVASSSISSIEYSVTPSRYAIGLGDTEELPVVTATILLTEAYPSRTSSVGIVTDWTSSDIAVASISDGMICANEIGSTELTATVLDRTFSVNVNVLANIADCTVTVDDSESYVYTGSEIEPGVSVMDGFTDLTEGRDYEVSYSNNIDAGTATVVVTGIGDYAGTNSAEFIIGRADIGDAHIDIYDEWSDGITYDGTSQEPFVEIYSADGEDFLSLGIDYTIEYSDNINAGTATVTATGIGNYQGTLSATFEIEKAEQEVTASLEESSIVYGKTTNVTASGIGDITYSSSDENVVTVSEDGLVTAVGAGDATIIVTAAGNDNYKSGTTEICITVEKAARPLAMSITEATIVYGDSVSISALSVGNGAITYTSNDTSIVTVGSAGNVTAVGTGTTTVTVTAEETDNYYETSLDVSFTVEKTDQTITATVENETITCGRTSQITVDGIGELEFASSDETVAEVDEDGIIAAVGVGTATITITALGDDNVNAASTTLDITVEEAQYTLGDVNRDGEVTYLDAMMVLRYDALLIDLEEDQKLAGDVNGDGEVSSLDAIKILRMDAGLITEF